MGIWHVLKLLFLLSSKSFTLGSARLSFLRTMSLGILLGCGLRFTLGELISMTVAIWRVTVVIMILPIILVSVVTVILIMIIWMTAAIRFVKFPAIVIGDWVTSYIIDAIPIKIIWVHILLTRHGLSLNSWDAFVIVKVIDVSENLNES